MMQLKPPHEFVARHVCSTSVSVSESYDMPRQAFEPPQCGCTSKMPPISWHIISNWSCVSISMSLDVTIGVDETPPSHSVSGTGVSGSTGTPPAPPFELVDAPPALVVGAPPALAVDAPPAPDVDAAALFDVELDFDDEPPEPLVALFEAEPLLELLLPDLG